MSAPPSSEISEPAEQWLSTAPVDGEVFALVPGYAALLITADGLRWSSIRTLALSTLSPGAEFARRLLAG